MGGGDTTGVHPNPVPPPLFARMSNYPEVSGNDDYNWWGSLVNDQQLQIQIFTATYGCMLINYPPPLYIIAECTWFLPKNYFLDFSYKNRFLWIAWHGSGPEIYLLAPYSRSFNGLKYTGLEGHNYDKPSVIGRPYRAPLRVMKIVCFFSNLDG